MSPERRYHERAGNRVSVRVYLSSAGWAVQWRTAQMPVPAFWYFGASETRARAMAAALQGWVNDREVSR